MSDIVIPKNYKSQLNLYETQVAIKTVKDFFQGLLAERLHLLRVSAPLFVDPTSGLNDNLNGVERPVNFHIAAQGDREAEIVQSLAKWKRYALQKYGFKPGEGLYTDMSAIRHILTAMPHKLFHRHHKGIIDGNVSLIQCLHPRFFAIVPWHFAG
jgi:aspartate--ammonia ligase